MEMFAEDYYLSKRAAIIFINFMDSTRKFSGTAKLIEKAEDVGSRHYLSQLEHDSWSNTWCASP